MRVEDSEIDPGHDSYLAVIDTYAGPVGDAMLVMAGLGGKAARSLDDADLAAAAQAMEDVSETAADFLRALSSAHCPSYLRGADEQLRDALQRILRGSEAGAAAASARDAAQVVAAGRDIDTASADILAAAQRITDWRSGAARP